MSGVYILRVSRLSFQSIERQLYQHNYFLQVNHVMQRVLYQAVEKRFRGSRYKAKTGEKAQFMHNK